MKDAALRKMIWEEYLDAERTNRYWCHMSERIHRKDRFISIVGIGAASATALSLATSLLGSTSPVWLAFFSLLVSLVAFYMRLSRETTIAAKMHDAAHSLRTDAEILWSKVDSAEETELRIGVESLKRRYSDLAGEVSTALPTNHKLNERCQQETMRALGLSSAVTA